MNLFKLLRGGSWADGFGARSVYRYYGNSEFRAHDSQGAPHGVAVP
jgi:hypothetical protein